MGTLSSLERSKAPLPKAIVRKIDGLRCIQMVVRKARWSTAMFDLFYALFCSMGQQMEEPSYTGTTRATRNV